ITRVYSRRGDLGETSLLFGPRVGKDHRRVELLGTLDELSSQLGQARALGVDSEVDRILRRLQDRLYEVGAEVASTSPAKHEIKQVHESDVKSVERVIDLWDAKLKPTRAFILPSGTQSSTCLHLARAVCRRAKRRACALLRFDPSFSPRVGAWLNRIGDLIFVLARFENLRLGVDEEFAEDYPEDADLF
ncbi:MAG: cob(I)yrinic acid a,c-diamide adenosyltransferase, partial [Thermoguttaceae bacterium]|nr:cob(I)yrinic acid a,c-diamide adenosyltransferase [Thermoguttaceae bacterium]